MAVKSAATTGSRTHLVAPLPLEGNGHLQQDGDDPREVDITHDLTGEGGEKEEKIDR